MKDASGGPQPGLRPLTVLHVDQAELLFALATHARNLGNFRLARHLLDDLLRRRLNRDLLVDVLVLAASVWQGLGSLEGARALIERAAKHAGDGDAARLERVRHQQAKLLEPALQEHT